MFILPESVVFFGGGKLNFETKWIGSILDSEEYAFLKNILIHQFMIVLKVRLSHVGLCQCGNRVKLI